MYVCMYVCMYVGMYVGIYGCMYVYMYEICICGFYVCHVCIMYVSIYVCICFYMYIFLLYVCMYVYVRILVTSSAVADIVCSLAMASAFESAQEESANSAACRRKASIAALACDTTRCERRYADRVGR